MTFKLKSISKEKNIFLYLEEILYPCGTLHYVDQGFSFSYSPAWLTRPNAFPLFDGFPLTAETFTSPTLPLPFEDATADAFGRKVMRRGAAFAGKFLDENPVFLNEFDFFVNTHPISRQGRFVFSEDAAKLHNVEMFEKNISKHTLRHCVYSFDQEKYSIVDFLTCLKYMHSNGGMRPKYAFLQDDELWLAKTNSREDVFSNGVLWEAVNLSMARECGISVPPFFYDNNWLSVRRFDRENGLPVPYISAKTMLNLPESDRISYADIAKHCDIADAQELFRRCCFNSAVANCDEHLKNHGFLRKENTWRLSSVFDIMSFPVPEMAQEHSLIIGNESFFGTPANILADIEHFHLFEDDARYIADQIFKTVQNNYCATAKKFGATNEQIEEMAISYIHNSNYAIKTIRTSRPK